MLLVLRAVSAQTIDINKNAYRTGDMVTKQQIEYKEPGQKGEGLLWDISGIWHTTKRTRTCAASWRRQIVGTEILWWRGKSKTRK